MTCNCILEMQQKISEHYSEYKDVRIPHSFSFGGGKMEAFIPVEFEYYEKKKDGEYKQKKTTGTIRPSFCAFCGKPQDEEKPEDKEGDKNG